MGQAAKTAGNRQREMQIRADRASDSGGRDRCGQYRSGLAQHAWLLRQTHCLQSRVANQGQRITSQLDRPGLVRIECDSHGWMLAWVYVADSPYYARTAKDGSFSITDIPPGDYTLVATQNYAGDTDIPVTVKANEAAKVSIELKKSSCSVPAARGLTLPNEGNANEYTAEREMDQELRQPGAHPDRSTVLTRRTFLHNRSCTARPARPPTACSSR